MDYEQRQREVERIRQELEQNQDFSSSALGRRTSNQPEELRRDLYAQYWRMGTESNEPSRRAGIAEFFVSRVPVETGMLRGQLLKWLQDFRKEDFSGDAVAKLNAMPWTPEYCPEVIRILGIAGGDPVLLRLNAYLGSHPLPQPPPVGYQASNTWAALLGLARQGNEPALNTIIRRVRAEQDIVLRVVLFADLGYTLQPAAFDTLRVYLNSSARLPTIKDHVLGTLEASRAAAVFSKYIAGFPIQETDFSEAQTMQARAWANAQNSWHFK
jgi:hypothetical protein